MSFESVFVKDMDDSCMDRVISVGFVLQLCFFGEELHKSFKWVMSHKSRLIPFIIIAEYLTTFWSSPQEIHSFIKLTDVQLEYFNRTELVIYNDKSE